MVEVIWADEPLSPDHNPRKRKLALEMQVGPP